MNDKENKLYTDFIGKNVNDGITADNFDSLKNDGFITPDNKQFFDDLLRVGWLSGQLSSSGPIPGSSLTAYKGDVLNSGTKYNIFQPSEGQVYQLGPLSYQVTGASGTVTIEQWLYAGDNIDGTLRRVLVGNSSTGSSGYNTIFEGGPNMPIYVDANSYVAFEATGTFSSVSVYLNVHRVR